MSKKKTMIGMGNGRMAAYAMFAMAGGMMAGSGGDLGFGLTADMFRTCCVCGQEFLKTGYKYCPRCEAAYKKWTPGARAERLAAVAEEESKRAEAAAVAIAEAEKRGKIRLEEVASDANA